MREPRRDALRDTGIGGQGEKVNRDQREWGELGNAERSNDGDI